jgi:4-amino-4-deoxy-L-arabinose transferase-like glycosyltransferase
MQLSDFQKGLVIFLLAVLLLGGIFFINRIFYADVFNKEEAQHAVYGLWLYKDLRAMDLVSFWYDTQRQMFWPFLHSWVLALTFLVLGVSYVSSRFLSLMIFIATLLLMYAVSFRLSNKSGWKIGLLSVFLALSSPIMAHYATVNTLEGLGALIFMASFYFYTVCEERKVVYEYVILGILIGLSIYTNYLYAYLMIPAFVLVTVVKLSPLFVEGVSLRRRGEKEAVHFLWWAYKKFIVLAVLMLFVAAWFLTAAFSRKIMLLLQAIFRFSGGETPLGLWQNLTYYLKAIVFNYSFSPWLGLLILVSLFMPFVAKHYRQVNKLYVLIWMVLTLATLTVPTKAPQFIYILFPFLFLIFSVVFFYFMERAGHYPAVLALIVILPALLSLPALNDIYFPPRPTERILDVLNYFRGSILPRHPIAAAINSQRLSPEEVSFHFWDWNAPVLSDPIMGEEEMFRNGQYLLTVEPDPSSNYQSEVLDDSLSRWNVFLAGKLRLGQAKEFSSRRFEGLGLTAKIYEKAAR